MKRPVFFYFVSTFWSIVWHVRHVVLAQLLLIVLGAFALVGIGEMGMGDALYFSFITGLTIGYGDIVVSTLPGRIIAVLIGLVGILFTGMVVAAAVKAVQMTMDSSQQNR